MAIVILYHNSRGIPDKLEIGNPAHSGGEGRIYFSKDGHYAIKIYHAGKVSLEKKRFLERITLLGNNLTSEEAQFLCWPLALVQTLDGNTQVGCVTRRIPTPTYRPLSYINCTPEAAAKQFREGRSWSHYLQIARGIARAVAVLHGRGCAHADLSNFNFLVNPEDREVVLLDLDGLVVPGFLPAQVLGTPGIIAPEVIAGTNNPNELSDRHSLAVQILQTLLFRNVLQPLRTYDPDNIDNDERLGWGREAIFSENPTNRSNRPRDLGVPLFHRGVLSYKILTPTLQQLAERACIKGLHDPPKRPSAREWINTLSYALDELYRCPHCRQHYPYPHWLKPVQRRSCPFCGQRVSGRLPSVASLYEPRSRGKYTFTQRYLILGDGWKLFADVLDPQRNPPMHRRNEPSVGHMEWDDKNKANRLVNDEDNIWHARLSGDESVATVGKGTSLPMQPGVIIHFGEGRRLLVVGE